MQISSTHRNFQTPKANYAQQPQTESFSPAGQQDLVSTGNSAEGQDRFDGSALQPLVTVFYGGIGAAGGAVVGTIAGAAFGLGGWGTAASGLGGLVAGAVAGGMLANK
jgi:hypothetical protein